MPRKKSVSPVPPVPGSKVAKATLPQSASKASSTKARFAHREPHDPSFGVALRAANAELDQALEEQRECEIRLAQLGARIPSLQGIILALGGSASFAPGHHEIGIQHPSWDAPKPFVPPQLVEATRIPKVGGRGVVPNNFGSEAARNALKGFATNLRGMGSIAAGQVGRQEPPGAAEGDFLGEAEGQEIVGDLPVQDVS